MKVTTDLEVDRGELALGVKSWEVIHLARRGVANIAMQRGEVKDIAVKCVANPAVIV